MNIFNYLFILLIISYTQIIHATEVEEFNAKEWEGYSRRQRIENLEKVMETFTKDYRKTKTDKLAKIIKQIEKVQETLKQTQSNNFDSINMAIEKIKSDLKQDIQKDIVDVKGN